VGCISAIALGPHIETQSQSIVWQFLAVAGGFALILDAVLPLGRNPLSWFLSRRPLVWLGKLTYGLYVYHIISLEAGGVIVQAVQRHWWADSPLMALLLRSLVSFAITVTIAAISYRFFESFFLRLKDKFSRVKSRPVDQTLA
jgi:peptidoglycan/LPS O-acetylase OafA/YrhL